MKIQNKYTLKTATLTKISALAFILLLAMSLMMVFTQPGLAQIGVPQPQETAGYITVAPALIGVGQTATVNLWTFPIPTNYLYGYYWEGYTGITVTFIKPDGTEDTFMPVDGTGQFDPGQTEATGSLFFFYEPDMAGDWSVTMSKPEQNITDSSGTVIYEACTSEPFYFTVTEEEQLAGLLNGYPWAELPDEDSYWKYPINSNNREWSAISGEWLGITTVNSAGLSHWQPYGSAPTTAHIVWSQPFKAGGIIGGDYGSLSYMTGMNLGQAVIMMGKAFVNVPNTGQFDCIDLTTGEVVYTATGSVTCGVHLPGNPYIQSRYDPSVVLASSYGSIPTPYLFGADYYGNWNYYDPFTGTLVRTISNSSSATLVDGTNLAYGVAGGNFFAWDMSKVIGNNWPTGIVWEQPLPESILIGSTSVVSGIRLLGVSTDASAMVLKTPNEYWGYSTEDGTLLWNFTLTYATTANQQTALYGVDAFIVFDPVATSFHCYSMLTGAELWESDSFTDSPWATTWTVYVSESNDYDNFYVQFPDGTMAAMSMETGETLWRSEPILSTEYTANAVPFVIGHVLVGGNLYGYAGYSTSYTLDPVPRFAMLVCINATTGDITWTLNGGVYPTAAASGYFIALGQYDGNIYCLGKGQTSTSVTIQDNVVAKGDTVLITGNVLDESPAQPGTPAVSDEDMSEWMDYLNMQNSTLLNNPPTPDGVPVNLYLVKPDGTEEWIATVTSNSYGNYMHKYVPSIEGDYIVIAKFAGSESYWSSSSQTFFTVTPAAAAGGPIEPEEPTTPPPTEEPTTTPPTEEPTTEVPTTEEPTTTPPTEEPSAEAPFPTTEVVIVAAVAVAAVVGIGAYWILRRR